MYERNLWKIMEAYEHMDEFPCTVHEKIRVYNLQWDEDDLAETPELEDITSDEFDVEYTQEYEGDHRGRTEQIEKNFMEFHGCVPEYDEELLDAEILESTEDGNGVSYENQVETELADAIFSSDKKELCDTIIQILGSISLLDKNSFMKVRNDFYVMGKNCKLKDSIVKSMDFLLDD